MKSTIIYLIYRNKVCCLPCHNPLVSIIIIIDSTQSIDLRYTQWMISYAFGFLFANFWITIVSHHNGTASSPWDCITTLRLKYHPETELPPWDWILTTLGLNHHPEAESLFWESETESPTPWVLMILSQGGGDSVSGCYSVLLWWCIEYKFYTL